MLNFERPSSLSKLFKFPGYLTRNSSAKEHSFRIPRIQTATESDIYIEVALTNEKLAELLKVSADSHTAWYTGTTGTGGF